mmetsp:Transcript_63249/g.74034  ORF Transcript_63249/g.74034 Transcript_63249/m.74034 type:complete len:285 (-) Transcript_63249:191-1045(-)
MRACSHDFTERIISILPLQCPQQPRKIRSNHPVTLIFSPQIKAPVAISLVPQRLQHHFGNILSWHQPAGGALLAIVHPHHQLPLTTGFVQQSPRMHNRVRKPAINQILLRLALPFQNIAPDFLPINFGPAQLVEHVTRVGPAHARTHHHVCTSPTRIYLIPLSDPIHLLGAAVGIPEHRLALLRHDTRRSGFAAGADAERIHRAGGQKRFHRRSIGHVHHRDGSGGDSGIEEGLFRFGCSDESDGGEFFRVGEEFAEEGLARLSAGSGDHYFLGCGCGECMSGC